VFDEHLKIYWPRTAGGTDYVLSTKDLQAPGVCLRRPALCREIIAKRHLIIGASGQVGGALIEKLGVNACFGTYSTSPVAHSIHFCMSAAAQDSTLIANLLTATRPDVTYICAAKTWVDGCEKDTIATRMVNTHAPVHIARMASSLGSKIVFFSTDYVFDGKAGPYNEDDIPSPINVYGESKLEAERAILDVNKDALIIRTTVVYGPEQLGKNFVYQLISKLKANESFACLTDQFSTPTYNRDLIEMVVELVEKNYSGIFNCVGTEVMSRYEFAQQIANVLSLDTKLIRKTTTPELERQARSGGRTLAARGLRLGLYTNKADAVLENYEPRSVLESLKHWLTNQRGKRLDQLPEK